jgi:hypothetical protein
VRLRTFAATALAVGTGEAPLKLALQTGKESWPRADAAGGGRDQGARVLTPDIQDRAAVPLSLASLRPSSISTLDVILLTEEQLAGESERV